MTASSVSRMRVRLLGATVAAVLALLFLLPVFSGDGDPPRCTSTVGTPTPCDTSGQNLAVVAAFAAGGLVWWLSGSRKLPPFRRR